MLISVDLLMKSNERHLWSSGHQAGLRNCCPVKSRAKGMTSWRIWQHLDTSLLAWTAVWEWMGAIATATHFTHKIHYSPSYITDVCEKELQAQLAHYIIYYYLSSRKLGAAANNYFIISQSAEKLD